MSHFAKYKKEREGKEVLETEHGFAVWYQLNPEVVYLEDIYVDLYHRQEGLASKMADEVAKIAKEKGCTKMLGSVNAQAHGADTSIRVLHAYGMKLHSVDGQMIYFIKEI